MQRLLWLSFSLFVDGEVEPAAEFDSSAEDVLRNLVVVESAKFG